MKRVDTKWMGIEETAYALNLVYEDTKKVKLDAGQLDRVKQFPGIDPFKMEVMSKQFPFPLDNVQLKPSKIHGRGVFVTKKVTKGQLITMYSGDFVYYSPDSNASYMSCTVSDNVTTEQLDANKRNYRYYNDYKFVSKSYSVVGSPEYDKNPAYMGHFVNDAARPTKDEKSFPIYKYVSSDKSNCIFTSIDDLQIAVVALRDIEVGEELYAHYGISYWMDKLAREAVNK